MIATTALEMNALRIPHEVCVQYRDTSYTWKTLEEEANRYANGLGNRGIRRGDHVALLMKNSADFIVMSYAVWKVGAVLVPIHYRSATPEVAYILQHANVKAILIDESYVSLVTQALSEVDEQPSFVVHMGERVEGNILPKTSIRANTTKSVGTHIEGGHFAELLYTQGTTGKPKGALFTHNQVMDTAMIYERMGQMKRRDCYVVSVPLCHGLALNAIVLMTALVGGSILIEDHFDPEEVLDWFQHRQVTHFFGVPSMYHALLEKVPDNFAAPSLRIMNYGAAPMPVDLLDRAIQLFPTVQFFNFYGTTESGPTGLTLLPTRHAAHKGKTGKPMPLTAVRIVNEYMEDVPKGEQGEIVIKSPAVMEEYYNDPAATFTAKKNGWLFTGDLAVADEEGFISIVGRKDNMILSGGETVYAVDIETALIGHPKIEDAVVMGIPDPLWGEIVAATIVLKKGETLLEETLVQYCKEHLASYKIPKKFVFVDELPRSTSGKLLKDHLKETLKQ